MRVVIIGAGIGGLVLAQGLRAIGVDVSVHDRDSHAGDTGGYRLRLNSAAMGALRRHVSPGMYPALLASGSGPRMFQRFTMFDHHLRPLLHLSRDAGGDDLLIGRIPLRTILTHGLDDVVRFGHEFTHGIRHTDGTVTAHFGDGDTERADVLVGADGVHSRVTTALAGRPTARRLDIGGLAGRTPMNDRLRGLLPVELNSGPAFAIGPGGTAVFLSLRDPATSVVDPADCIEVPAHPEAAYLLWGAITELDTARSRTPAQQHARANALFDGWARPFRDLVRVADTETVGEFPYLAADPGNLIPWRPGPITALGDAIHAMPPTGGRGAATAIRDADHLINYLQLAHRSMTTVALAVHGYHQEIAAYSTVAVRESLKPLTWRRYLDNPAVFHVARRVLPIGDRGLRAATALRDLRCRRAEGKTRRYVQDICQRYTRPRRITRSGWFRTPAPPRGSSA